MSRSFDRNDHEHLHEEHPQSRMRLSQGRGGGSGSAESKERRNSGEESRAGAMGNAISRAELAAVVDAVTADQPTMSEFIERLEKRGVQAIPSIQSGGRLNGMCYRVGGRTENASSLGRAYTAQGLQQRKGVGYDPARDGAALRRAVEKAGIRHPDRVEPGRQPSSGRRDRTRDRLSGLSPDERGTLADIGRFRTVRVEDVIRHRYAGNAAQFRQDLRALLEQELADRRTIRHAKSGRDFEVLVLTERGKKSLKNECNPNCARDRGQQYYAGFVKPAEVRHDVGIYRMYQAETERIEREGGTVKRVVLDFELKKRVFCEMNKPDRSGADYAERKREIAAQHGLKTVHGRVVFPDLRIEYETRDLKTEKVDLELATSNYKGAQIRTKSAAGLKIYAPDSAAGSPAIQDPEIVAELISL